MNENEQTNDEKEKLKDACLWQVINCEKKVCPTGPTGPKGATGPTERLFKSSNENIVILSRLLVI